MWTVKMSYVEPTFFSDGSQTLKNVKKMCATTSNLGVSAMVGFTYPVLHQGKRWFVDFFAMDPSCNEMRRKKYFISEGLK